MFRNLGKQILKVIIRFQIVCFCVGEILQTVKDGEGKDFYPLLIEAAVLERMATNSIIVTGDSGSVFSRFRNIIALSGFLEAVEIAIIAP